MRSYNYDISTAKAIAIILMVIGHSGCPADLVHFIYLFHMPVFFFCSGYFFAPPTSLGALKCNAVKKIKRLYYPYVKWSVLFLLMHNIFFYLGIYNSEYGYEGKVFYIYSLEDYIKRLFYVLLTMDKHEPLLGGYWFLKVLLLSSLLANLLFYIQNHYKLSKHFSICFLLLVLIISMFYNSSTVILGNFSTLFLASVYFVFGYYVAKSRINDYKYSNLELIAMLALLVGATIYYHSISMFSEGHDILVYLLFSLIGILFLLGCSKKINKIDIGKIFFYYVGSNTMIILTFHFLAFKIVSFFIIWYYNLDFSRLSQFPVVTDVGSLWWIIYTLAGVFIPLCFSYLCKRISF